MSKHTKIEAGDAQKEPRAVRTGARDMTAVAVPRAWLVALTALLVVPWILAGFYLWGPEQTAGRATTSATSSAAEPHSAPGRVGPWGQLTITPIVISPPIEYISRNWGPPAVSAWHLARVRGEQLEQYLSSFGLAREEVARLRSTARADPRTGGTIVTPDPELLRTLGPQVRARLYPQLGKNPLNYDQMAAYRYFGASIDEWLPPSLISPRTRELVEPLIYRREGFLYLADINLARSQISDPEEVQRLAKGLLRQATVLVRLQIHDASQLGAIAEYWGRGGRRTDIRPLLESIVGAGSDRSIDISHLLPSLAREHLYRYPRITVADFEKPSLANCLWTALNFFRADPDDRFLDEDFALKRLSEDYYVVHDGLQLGDIVAFVDGEGNLFHVAVYLADDLVFGKNGISRLAPWTILPIERLKGHYVEYADEWHVTYHRRKDL